jgi:hypothetical protein
MSTRATWSQMPDESVHKLRPLGCLPLKSTCLFTRSAAASSSTLQYISAPVSDGRRRLRRVSEADPRALLLLRSLAIVSPRSPLPTPRSPAPARVRKGTFPLCIRASLCSWIEECDAVGFGVWVCTLQGRGTYGCRTGSLRVTPGSWRCGASSCGRSSRLRLTARETEVRGRGWDG